jgi:tocopherol O-methyltransferase
MKQFSNKDVEDYYNQSEVHYRMFWKLKDSMGLHYGVWDNSTKDLKDAVLNTNRRLMLLGEIKQGDRVLDAGCGIGGSSIFLAKHLQCRATGITLSAKQAATATQLAKEHGVSDLVNFEQKDYTNTGFPDNTFDIVWAIESMQTGPDKNLFFKEMSRILKPGGKVLFADMFKPKTYDIKGHTDMLTMLNGWAMSDLISLDQLKEVTGKHGFEVSKIDDVTRPVRKSVNKIYVASILGMFGTKIYNMFYNASYFSRIHYKTGLAQIKAYKRAEWGYYLIVCTNLKKA